MLNSTKKKKSNQWKYAGVVAYGMNEDKVPTDDLRARAELNGIITLQR